MADLNFSGVEKRLFFVKITDRQTKENEMGGECDRHWKQYDAE
jgi:hypothetical protein